MPPERRKRTGAASPSTIVMLLRSGTCRALAAVGAGKVIALRALPDRDMELLGDDAADLAAAPRRDVTAACRFLSPHLVEYGDPIPSITSGARWRRLTKAGQRTLEALGNRVEANIVRKILRYEVPVDDQWHDLRVAGQVVHVACRRADTVDLWALREPGARPAPITLRVYTTGEDVPEQAQHVGSAVSPDGRLVWHLMRRLEPDRAGETPT